LRSFVESCLLWIPSLWISYLYCYEWVQSNTVLETCISLYELIVLHWQVNNMIPSLVLTYTSYDIFDVLGRISYSLRLKTNLRVSAHTEIKLNIQWNVDSATNIDFIKKLGLEQLHYLRQFGRSLQISHVANDRANVGVIVCSWKLQAVH